MQEFLAIRAFDHKKQVEYLKLLAVVKAIEFSTGSIMSAISNANGGDASPPSPDGVNNLLDTIKGMLIPALAEDKEEKARKVKETIKREIERGPLIVQSMANTSSLKKKGLN